MSDDEVVAGPDGGRRSATEVVDRLCAQATAGRWDPDVDIDWTVDVDVDEVAATDRWSPLSPDVDRFAGTPVAKWGQREWLTFTAENRRWMLSQVLHGEDAAVVCASTLAEVAPSGPERRFAAFQCDDELRHRDVFDRYLVDKLGGVYPVDGPLGAFMDVVVAERRWDFAYLGMHVFVEGLALSSFGFIRQLTGEPLLRQLLRYVMADEARHVAFGVVALGEVFAELSDVEMLERQEFALEAAVAMKERLVARAVWERFGVDADQVTAVLADDPAHQLFQRMLFAKIVPTCARVGLLDRNGGWLRSRFAELGVSASLSASLLQQPHPARPGR